MAPVTPATGNGVLHLFCSPSPDFQPADLISAVADAEQRGVQVVTVSMLGHKADVAVMAIANDFRLLRDLQTAVQRAGLVVLDSYVSLTEVSEYAKGMPEAMINARLHPQIPPRNIEATAWCFYPMSKKREGDANWFTLPYDERNELMHEHGASGRTFAGRVVQYITGSTGLDDYEWGVTLFAVRIDDLKDVVYTMRFDRASALYADFGPFYVGMITPVDELAHSLAG